MWFFFRISALKTLAVAISYDCVFRIDLQKIHSHFILTYDLDRVLDLLS